MIFLLSGQAQSRQQMNNWLKFKQNVMVNRIIKQWCHLDVQLKLYSRCMDELLQFIPFKVYLRPHRMVSINNVCINFIAIWHINYIKKPFLLIIWYSYYIDISKNAYEQVCHCI